MKIFNICLTGISGSGKSTIARRLAEELNKLNVKIQMIDGDDTRNAIGNLFGHTREERMKMNCINRLLAKYLNQNGINTIIAIVAPFDEMRENMRNDFGDSYIEVYVKCSQAVCKKRDVKGYYKMETQGIISNLNGSNDVYEIPKSPHIIVDTEMTSVDEGVSKIIKYLVDNGYAV